MATLKAGLNILAAASAADLWLLLGISETPCSWRSNSAGLIQNKTCLAALLLEWEYEIVQPHANMKNNSDVLMKTFLLLLIVTKLLSCFSPALLPWRCCWDCFIAPQECTWADMQREKNSRALKPIWWTFVMSLIRLLTMGAGRWWNSPSLLQLHSFKILIPKPALSYRLCLLPGPYFPWMADWCEQQRVRLKEVAGFLAGVGWINALTIVLCYSSYISMFGRSSTSKNSCLHFWI